VTKAHDEAPGAKTACQRGFILPPHVLGPKYERRQRPRNSQGFRIGKSQGNLSNDIRRGQQSPP